jgi:hypothetical protein
MNHQDLYKLITTVQKNVRCPQCGKAYDFTMIQIRGIVDSIVFLELNCADHMPLLATVSLAKPGKNQKFLPNKDQITPDDVIESYHFFKGWQGNFAELFKESTEAKNSPKNNSSNK